MKNTPDQKKQGCLKDCAACMRNQVVNYEERRTPKKDWTYSSRLFTAEALYQHLYLMQLRSQISQAR
jgi:hypothetical protein